MEKKNKNTKTTGPVLPNERELLRRTSEGDWEAYAEIFNFYVPKLLQFIYPFTGQSKEDAEEVIQEVFLKIWEKKEILVAIRSFDSYLFRMAKNKLTDILLEYRSARNKHRAYELIKETYDLGTEQSILYIEYYEAARFAITNLSPKLRTVFLMSTEDDLPLDEISEKLSLPKETVKKRLYMACTSIKNYLQLHAGWQV